MKIKKLFDENQRYTTRGHEIAEKIGNTLESLLREYVNEGYSVLQLEFIVRREINIQLDAARLICGIPIRKNKKK